jgi:hypothetical protein
MAVGIAYGSNGCSSKGRFVRRVTMASTTAPRHADVRDRRSRRIPRVPTGVVRALSIDRYRLASRSRGRSLLDLPFDHPTLQLSQRG